MILRSFRKPISRVAGACVFCQARSWRKLHAFHLGLPIRKCPFGEGKANDGRVMADQIQTPRLEGLSQAGSRCNLVSRFSYFRAKEGPPDFVPGWTYPVGIRRAKLWFSCHRDERCGVRMPGCCGWSNQITTGRRNNRHPAAWASLASVRSVAGKRPVACGRVAHGCRSLPPSKPSIQRNTCP